MRRIVVALASFAAIVVIVAIAVVSRSGDDAPAQLRIREGKASVERGETAPRLATEGEDLASGDVVRTDNAGQVQIDLFDGSLVRMDVSTEIALRTVERADGGGRDVLLALNEGRAWFRADDATPGRFRTDFGGARIGVKGTTYLGDCRETPKCYAVGFEGEAEVAAGGEEMDAGPGDCVVIEDRELDGCDENRLGLVDEWVRENLAEDQQLEVRRSPSATATPSATPRRSFAPAPVVPAATPTPTVEPEPEDTEEPPLTLPPKETKRPRRRSPTPEPTPFDRTPVPSASLSGA
jgi:hypothetical protein